MNKIKNALNNAVTVGIVVVDMVVIAAATVGLGGYCIYQYEKERREIAKKRKAEGKSDLDEFENFM